MEAAVEALLEFGETRARVVGGEGVRGVSGSGAGAGPPGGGQEQIMRDELLAMQLQEELLREGGRAETPFVGGGEISQALGGLWGSVSAAAADLGNLAVTTGRAVAEGVTSVAGNLMAEGGGAGAPGPGPGPGQVGRAGQVGGMGKRRRELPSCPRIGSRPWNAPGCTGGPEPRTRRTSRAGHRAVPPRSPHLIYYSTLSTLHTHGPQCGSKASGPQRSFIPGARL